MKRYVVIDTETTGLDPFKGNHRVIEIALIEVVDYKITGKLFQSYINPEGKKSTKNALKVHHITDKSLTDKPSFKEIEPHILEFINNDELVFYNKQFDLKFLDKESASTNLNIHFSREFESRCLMEEVGAKLNRRISLDSACRINHLDTSERKIHGALIDAKLTAQLLIAIDKGNAPLKYVPQKNKHSEPEKFPFPRAYQGVQLNFCKNSDCSNYGKPPTAPKKNPDGSYHKKIGNNYKLTVKRKNNQPDDRSLVCGLCGSYTKLISNKAFVQESNRLKSIFSFKDHSCPNTGLSPDTRKGIPDGRRYKRITKKVRNKIITLKSLLPPCLNNNKGLLEYPDGYWRDSKNVKTVKPNNNLPVVNHPDESGQTHLIKELTSQTFKCKKCHTKFTIPLDPQKGQKDHQVNYQIFVELVNKGIINRILEKLRVNPTVIYSRIEFFYNQCIQFDQYQLKTNIQKLNGINLNLSIDRQHFYSNWSNKSDARRTKIVNTTTVDNDSRFALSSTLNFDFTSDYKYLYKEFIRIDEYSKDTHKRRYPQYILPEELVDNNMDIKPPSKHLLLQQTYSLLAHLETLKTYFNNASHINLYADDDTGFEMSICRVYSDIIVENKLSSTIVRNSKLTAEGEELENGWIKQETPIVPNKYLDLKFLTDFNIYAYNNASLNGVDNYFQMLRRRLNMMERPIQTQSSTQVWNGYGSYNPKHLSMLIEIFRVYNNYVLTDEKAISKRGLGVDPKTPAQKLGLVDDAYSIYDLIEFSSAKIFNDE